MSLLLQVSLGEAIDKHSILQIKSERISDEKKLVEVEKEKQIIYAKIGEYIEKYPFYYKCLYEINKQIWDDQEVFRNDELLTQTQKTDLCTKIIKDNDSRFRVKNKINIIANSNLKEQKSYMPQKALILHHLGMGDMITMNGAVRYLSTRYDEIMLFVKRDYEKASKEMYADDPTIRFHVVPDGRSPMKQQLIQTYKSQGYEVLKSGSYKQHFNVSRTGTPFYDQFYQHLGLNPSIRFEYSYFHVDKDQEERLYNEIISANGIKKYIFVHDKEGREQLLKNYNLDKDVYVFNVNRDIYKKGHKWKEVWKKTMNPIFHYKKLIQNAEEIHLLDSAFFCFAVHIDLSKVKQLVVYQRKNGYDIQKYFPAKQNWTVKQLGL